MLKSDVLNNQTNVWNKIKWFLLNYGIYFAFFLVFVYFAISSPSFLNKANLINISRQISINGIIAVGMTFVIISGGIDLSVGSVLAVAGIVLAYYAKGPSYNLLLGIVMALLVGLGCGFINGIFISVFKITPFIATLAMLTFASGLAFKISDSEIIPNLSPSLLSFSSGFFLGIPTLTWVMIILFILGYLLLTQMKFGKYTYAIGGNETTAKNSGINSTRIKIIIYSLTGMMAAISGILLTGRVAAGIPTNGGGYELNAIAAVVIGGTSLVGGKGTIWGTLIGCLLIGVLNNGLDLIGATYPTQLMVTGVVIAFAVLIDSIKNK